jgi:uncharacterized membrane protein
MADTTTLDPKPPTSGPVTATSDESLRTFTIVVYALYLAAFCNGFTALIGVILAYVKRADARGTPYESHFTNAIEVFWVGLVVSLAAIPLLFLFGLGIIVYCGLVVWYLYRTIKGLVRTLESRAY